MRVPGSNVDAERPNLLGDSPGAANAGGKNAVSGRVAPVAEQADRSVVYPSDNGIEPPIGKSTQSWSRAGDTRARMRARGN
jgi:hypothetical protein